MSHPYPVTAAMAVLLALSGCFLLPPEPESAAIAYPPDFALMFHVKAPAGSPDPTRQPSRYQLGADRVLRLAVGSEADKPWAPPAVADLTPAQMGRIYELADYVTYNGQTWNPAWPADQVAYHVSITRLGLTQITTLTPAQSPELVDLLSSLVDLSGR